MWHRIKGTILRCDCKSEINRWKHLQKITQSLLYSSVHSIVFGYRECTTEKIGDVIIAKEVLSC